MVSMLGNGSLRPEGGVDMLNDIYYNNQYIDSYRKDDDLLFDYRYENKGHYFVNKTIQRKIERIGNVALHQSICDLECAYGYGGYVTNGDTLFVEKAMEAYQEECLGKNVVAEFIRFHPFNSFSKKYANLFDFFVHDRNTIYVDLTQSREERWQQYDSNTRNIIRKASKQLKFEETTDVAPFISMYRETMLRNNADGFYFFSEDYFRRMMTLGGSQLFSISLEGIPICASFVLFGSEIAHYHLSASLKEYMKYNANYFLLDCAFDIAKSKGMKYFHLGGGRSDKADDSLFVFKRKFSKETLPFYVAGKIFMREQYDQLCELWTRQTEKKMTYFLKYRLPL